MKHILLLFSIVASHSFFAQTNQVSAKIVGEGLNEGEGRVLVVKASDSSVVKGSYLESFDVELKFDSSSDTNFLFVVDVPEFNKQYIAFSTALSKRIDLGEIRLIADLTLDEVKVSYKKPMFERTMDGMTINVEGTELQQLSTLFDVLKASPRLSSPDGESIEIVGKGAPQILIDRQAIISNEELKAIPADQVEKIEIITNPSAKYKAGGSGNGVIEIYTKNFKLEGYRMSVRSQVGVSTQLKPTGGLNLGYSYKKNKFTINSYLGANYNSSLQTNESTTTSQQGLLRQNKDESISNNQSSWSYYNLKMSYDINEKHKLTLGANGNTYFGGEKSESTSQYTLDDTLTTESNRTSKNKYKWLNSRVFMNYSFETDTLGSVLEVNLNYNNKISESGGTYLSTFNDQSTGIGSEFNVRDDSRNRPNIGELSVNYDHVFDTTGWDLSVGGSYSYLFNGKKYKQEELFSGNWTENADLTNSYDYTEQIGAVFFEVTKKWKKFGIRVGLRGEYTALKGYSNSLDKQFIDSSYILPFPSLGFMIEPSEKVAITVYYKSGIERPQFDSFDPFIKRSDSLSISTGNPYLKPSYTHYAGIELDLFYSYNLSVGYSRANDQQSTLNFINDTSFATFSTQGNARFQDGFDASLSLPIQLDWLDGWNSIWYEYNRNYFTSEFNRDPFFTSSYGISSYLTFKLPKKFYIMNAFSLHQWSNDEYQSKPQYNWGIRLTKKFEKNSFELFGEVQNLIPNKQRYTSFGSNYQTSGSSQNNFTTFMAGFSIKFGRLKAPADVKESSSGQSGRI
jgi:hypothetical protein